ncbi:MAG: 4Fe-4S dicluster domain-containing protein [Bacteriovoracaceae bacterium]
MSQINKEFKDPNYLDEVDRREFIKYMGLFSSMTLLSHCSRPAKNIIPFNKEIGEFSKKNYEFYNSCVNHYGFAMGITVKSYQGRPIKIEGQANHPFSLGSTSPFAQAELYNLYHPERLNNIYFKSKKIAYDEMKNKIHSRLKTNDGEDLLFIFPADHSPTLKATIKKIQKKYQKSNWISLSPWKMNYWNDVRIDESDIVICFDEDLFYGRPDYLKQSQSFMKKRKSAIDLNDHSKLNQLYVIQSTPTLVGAKADKVYFRRKDEIWNDSIDFLNAIKGEKTENPIVNDLLKKIHQKNVSVFINHSLHESAKDLEIKINNLLRTQINPIEFDIPENISKADLEDKLKRGQIKTLFNIDSDPYLWGPHLTPLLDKVEFKASLSFWKNISAKKSDLVVAKSHFLESWYDLEAPDKSISIQQPLISPIFNSVSTLTFLNLFIDKDEDSYETIFERNNIHWKDLLINGFSKQPFTERKLQVSNFTKLPKKKGIQLRLVPDSSIGYGENFKNPVLQELPKNFARITWQSAFYLNKKFASDHNLKNFDVIKIQGKDSTQEGPILILNGIADDTIVASLGDGQENRGINNFGFKDGEIVTITKTKKKKKLAQFQDDLSVENRNPIQEDRLPIKLQPQDQVKSLHPQIPIKAQAEGAQWGMTIDLTTCTGCQACVIACQTENNIPFVGEKEALKNRLLHWIRVDTYQINDRTYFQPVPCMHCEKAPCEVVCPVNATLHGNGGLNEMVYNRCVGTRYCSNNCPYRVRRFNFKAYSALKYPFDLGLNPDVSVRDRGVMEKCTYCIQRIREHEVNHDQTEIKTACAQVCPTNAIIFGDLKDNKSLVSEEKKSLRKFDLLAEEGTLPRTSYLKVIRYE